MNSHDGLVLVFTGSSIDAYYLEGLLKEAGVECMIRDLIEESTSAGWGAGAPESACHLFVTEDDVAKSLSIVEDYMKSRESL